MTMQESLAMVERAVEIIIAECDRLRRQTAEQSAALERVEQLCRGAESQFQAACVSMHINAPEELGVGPILAVSEIRTAAKVNPS